MRQQPTVNSDAYLFSIFEVCILQFYKVPLWLLGLISSQLELLIVIDLLILSMREIIISIGVSTFALYSVLLQLGSTYKHPKHKYDWVNLGRELWLLLHISIESCTARVHYFLSWTSLLTRMTTLSTISSQDQSHHCLGICDTVLVPPTFLYWITPWWILSRRASSVPMIMNNTWSLVVHDSWLHLKPFSFRKLVYSIFLCFLCSVICIDEWT